MHELVNRNFSGILPSMLVNAWSLLGRRVNEGFVSDKLKSASYELIFGCCFFRQYFTPLMIQLLRLSSLELPFRRRFSGNFPVSKRCIQGQARLSQISHKVLGITVITAQGRSVFLELDSHVRLRFTLELCCKTRFSGWIRQPRMLRSFSCTWSEVLLVPGKTRVWALRFSQYNVKWDCLEGWGYYWMACICDNCVVCDQCSRTGFGMLHL